MISKKIVSSNTRSVTQRVLFKDIAPLYWQFTAKAKKVLHSADIHIQKVIGKRINDASTSCASGTVHTHTHAQKHPHTHMSHFRPVVFMQTDKQ